MVCENATVFITEQYRDLVKKVLIIMNDIKYEKGGDFIVFDNEWGTFTADKIIDEVINITPVGLEVVINTCMRNSDIFFPKHGHDYLEFGHKVIFH